MAAVNEPMVFLMEAPAPFINANDRLHFHTRATLTAEWKNATKDAALRHGGYFTVPVHIAIWVHKTTSRKYDVNNLQLTAKAIVDGLVAAGVIFDDDNAHVIGPDMRAGLMSEDGNPAVSVRVRAATEDELQAGDAWQS